MGRRLRVSHFGCVEDSMRRRAPARPRLCSGSLARHTPGLATTTAYPRFLAHPLGAWGPLVHARYSGRAAYRCSVAMSDGRELAWVRLELDPGVRAHAGAALRRRPCPLRCAAAARAPDPDGRSPYERDSDRRRLTGTGLAASPARLRSSSMGADGPRLPTLVAWLAAYSGGR